MKISKNKAIFLDRDGTINVDKRYLHKTKDFKFIPGSLKALKLATTSAYNLIIITNQSGIGKDIFSHKDFLKLTHFMLKKFKEEIISADAIFYCPHAPEDKCNCRKPATNMIQEAKKRFNLDLNKSWVIGDKTSDIKLGENIGAKTILVKTGAAGRDKTCRVKPDYVAANLLEAVKIVLK